MLYGPGVVSGLTLTFKSDAPEPPPSTTEEGEKLTVTPSGASAETSTFWLRPLFPNRLRVNVSLIPGESRRYGGASEMISPSLLIVEELEVTVEELEVTVEELEVTVEELEVTVDRFCLPGRTITISARASKSIATKTTPKVTRRGKPVLLLELAMTM